MQKTENKIYSSIRGKGAGCVITNSDFYHLAARGTINRCLTSLRERGIICSLIVGIYDYPIYSELLQEQLPLISTWWLRRLPGRINGIFRLREMRH